MLAFEILVNGQRVCQPGVGRALSAVISYEHHQPGQITFFVGGVPLDTEALHAWNVPQIGVGDEVTIRIVETDTPDSPGQSHASFSGDGP